MEIPEHVLKYRSQMELTELQKYIDRVWNFLNGIKVGSVLNIAKITNEETRALFIEVVKMYMEENAWQGGISFSDDYSVIKKVLQLKCMIL